MAKFCKHCGSSLTEGKKFCAKCGTPTGAMESAPPAPDAWTCPACGHENAKGKFCAKCGGGKPEEAATPPVETLTPQPNDGNVTDAPPSASPAPNAWICPACGHENAKGKFCAKCGGGKPEESAAAPMEAPAPSPIENEEANMPPLPPQEAPVVAPSPPEPPSPAPTEAVQNGFEAPPAQAPKPRNNKTVILIVAVVVVAVAAFFGSSKLTESLYASKTEECAAALTESKTMLDNLAELPADAASDDVKKIAADLAKNAEKLNSIHGSLIGKLPKKPPQEKIWNAIGKNAELLSNAAAVVQSQERAFNPASIKRFSALCDECMTKWDEANAAASEATAKNQSLADIVPYADIKKDLQAYRRNKQAFDAKYSQEKYNEQRQARQAAQEELKRKGEVVFLADNAYKNGNDLILSGRFYNGTGNLVTGVKEMQVDIKVSLFGAEVQSLKDEPYAANLTGWQLAPQQSTDVVQLRLAGKAPEGDFNEFEAHVHKISWIQLKART